MRADETASLELGVQWLVAHNDSTLRFSDLFTVEDRRSTASSATSGASTGTRSR
jgi:hypothetical protein